MSNQKVLSSSTIEDDIEHSNRHKLEFENGKCFACMEVEKNIIIKLIGRKENVN